MESCKKNLFFISTYGFLMLFSSHQVSSSTDTIFPNQSLSGFETIVSSGGVFELGFFSQGTSNLFYLGIWYKQVIPKTIVWVANRGDPAPYITSINLSILDGNLVLYDNVTQSTIWWSARFGSRSGAAQAVLLDNGNLILRDGTSSSAVVLWQSFNNPSDTWLPGAKIWLGNTTLETRSKFLTSWNTLKDPSLGRYSLEVDPITRNSLITVFNGTISYWSSGAWDDRLRGFKQVTDTRLSRNLSFEFNLNESYVTYSVRYQNPFRLVMDVMGQLKAYTWLDKDQVWDSPWSAPIQKCKVYGYCGPFGICDENSSCKCAPTFRRPFRVGSYSNDSTGDCISEIKLAKNQCGMRNDKFLPLPNMKLATDPEEKVLVGTPFTTCDSACLTYCFCKAYAYDGNRCLIWTSVIFNLQQLDANDSEGRTFYIRLTSSEEISNEGNLEFISGRTKHRKVRNIVLAVLLPSVAATIIIYCLYSYFSSSPGSKRAQKDKKQMKDMLEGGIIDAEDDDGEHMFYLSLHDIMAATNAFSEENKLGEGGFGPVYKGKLLNGTDVAIKRLSKKSSQGLIEFKNEVVLIIKLQHKNLVRLLGYCMERDEKLLIYEYMSNKSLDALLFDPVKSKELDWEKRMKIIIGTTKGLQYLHEDSRLKIIHRDLKASNILLDGEMNPKISDFGTARIFGCKQIDDSTERIVGTFGYMSPEYALGGMISEKSDIYSFGVLLLEIISGKKATRFVHNDQKHSIIAYAWESWCETKGVSIIDESLSESYSSKEVMRCVHIALLCVQDHPKDRPTISQISYMLSNDHDLPIPIQPTFTNVLNCNHRLASSHCVFSINEVTQSTFEGR